MGNGQIRVQCVDGTWLAAPNMIHHYVTVNNYQPPDVFIETVLNPNDVAKELRWEDY